MTVEPSGPADQRSYHVLDDPVIYPVIAIGVLLTTAFPIFLEQQICLPVLNGLVIFPLFVWALREGRPRRAVGMALFWALCQVLAAMVASLLLPDRAGVAILGALDYRSQMLAWIASGQGVESSPVSFLPQQAGQDGLFLLVALLSAGLGALVLLAAALNAISFYLASLAQQASSPLLLALLSWPVWSLVRLLGLLACAAVLAEPLAVLDLRPQWWSGWWQQRRRLLAAGILLILLGLVLQLALAPSWPALRQATDLT